MQVDVASAQDARMQTWLVQANLVSVADLDFNWPCNSLIDKCCEQAREGAGGCTAPLATV